MHCSLRVGVRARPVVFALFTLSFLAGCQALVPVDSNGEPSEEPRLAAFDAQLGVTPSLPSPGDTVELQIYAVNEGSGTFTADVSVAVQAQDGDPVHQRPWPGVTFTEKEGWLLSSRFFMNADSKDAPYSARVFIQDSNDGTVYFDGDLLHFGGEG